MARAYLAKTMKETGDEAKLPDLLYAVTVRSAAFQLQGAGDRPVRVALSAAGFFIFGAAERTLFFISCFPCLWLPKVR